LLYLVIQFAIQSKIHFYLLVLQKSF